jgi:hypothetical protein
VAARRRRNRAESPYDYPEGDFLQLEAWFGSPEAPVPEGHRVLFMHATMDDELLPFRLELLLGADFVLGGLENIDLDDLQPTLVWLCYPYLREIISAITARSPLPAYFLPPITMMPNVTAQRDPPAAEGP